MDKNFQKIAFALIIIVVIISSCTRKRREYFPNGELKYEVGYRHGKKHGDYKEYFEDGSIHFTGSFDNGIESGEKIEYYPDSKIKSKTQMLKGKENGEHVSYYTSGKVQYRSSFKDGKQHGESKEYYESGVLKSINNFKNGVPHGESRFYHPNNELQMYSIISNGKTIYYEEFSDSKEFISEFRQIYTTPENVKIAEGDKGEIKISSNGPIGRYKGVRLIVSTLNLNLFPSPESLEYNIYSVGDLQKINYFFIAQDSNGNFVLNKKLGSNELIVMFSEDGSFSLNLPPSPKGTYMLYGQYELISKETHTVKWKYPIWLRYSVE